MVDQLLNIIFASAILCLGVLLISDRGIDSMAGCTLRSRKVYYFACLQFCFSAEMVQYIYSFYI